MSKNNKNKKQKVDLNAVAGGMSMGNFSDKDRAKRAKEMKNVHHPTYAELRRARGLTPGLY